MKLLVALYLVSFSFLIAAGEEGLGEANRLSYNFRFTEANKILDSLITEDPGSPFPVYIRTRNILWKYLGSGGENYYGEFRTELEKLYSLLDESLDKNEDNPDFHYLAGKSYALEAAALTARDASLDALWAADDAVNFFDKTIDLDNTYYDAYLGIGLFNYAFSFIPKLYRWAIKLAGLDSGRKEGFDRVKLAYEKGNRDTVEAAFHYARLMADYTGEYEQAEKILAPLLAEYPGNIQFRYQYAINLLKGRKPEQAAQEAERVIAEEIEGFRQTTAFAYLVAADSYFRLNKFEEALSFYNKYLEKTYRIEYTGIVRLRMAYSEYFLGNIEGYRKNLLLAGAGNRELPSDEYAALKSDRLIENGLSSIDSLNIFYHNMVLAGKYEVVYTGLDAPSDGIESDAFTLAVKSDAALHMGKYEEAVALAEKSFKLKDNSEKWIVPYAAVNAAEASWQLDDINSVLRFIEIADDNDDYLYENNFEERLNNLKIRLNRL